MNNARAILLALALLPLSLFAAGRESTLLVVPARQAMVRLAFDMQSLRQAEVVCWRAAGDDAAPALFHWSRKKWKPLAAESFAALAFLPRPPAKIIFLGSVHPALEQALDRPGIARFESFDAAMLVNNLDTFYAFSPAEWRLLSRRYGFMLHDLNAARREQSRYGDTPPPEVLESDPRRPPVLFRTTPPPAIVIEARPEVTDEPAADPDGAEPPAADPAE